MEPGSSAKPSIKARAAQELREFAVIAVYLYVCFAALTYLKFAILKAHGVDYEPFGFAAIKALICAKFMLLGRALHLGERFKDRALIWPTLYGSLVFFVLVAALNVLEEIVVGLIHGRSVAASVDNIAGGTLHQVIATSIIMLLIFIPFFAFGSLGEVLGERNLVMVFLKPRHRIERA
jgi:phosphatidylserine synthase